MSLRIKIIVVVLLLVGVGAFVFRSGFKRSVPGHIARWLKGESGGQQIANDLAEDIRTLPALAPLQAWSVDTLARFRSGQVRSNGSPSWHWEGPAVKLAPQERPEFITKQWGQTNKWGDEEPEIYVLLSANGEPESVAVVWGMYGTVVGPPDYPSQSNAWYAWFYAEAKPGIYTFYQNK